MYIKYTLNKLRKCTVWVKTYNVSCVYSLVQMLHCILMRKYSMCNRSAQFCLGTRECVKCSDTSHWLSIYNLPSILEKSRITWIMSRIYSPPPHYTGSVFPWPNGQGDGLGGLDSRSGLMVSVEQTYPQTGCTLLRGTYTLNRYKSLVWKECEWLALCAEWCKYARTDQMMIIYVIAGHCRRIFLAIANK